MPGSMVLGSMEEGVGLLLADMALSSAEGIRFWSLGTRLLQVR